MPDWLDRFTHALADRYRLERELGHGGMATVYLAQDLRHHRPVAVKALRPDTAVALGHECSSGRSASSPAWSIPTS